MPSIETSPHPLGFKAGQGATGGDAAIWTRTRVRSLAGMQKEAFVEYGPTGTVWRMVADEGAGLNGTDLAPFPLAFFNAGLLASTMAEIEALAEARGLSVDGAGAAATNTYMIEGSATQGTQQGSSLPADIHLSPPTGADQDAWMEILRHAVAASPVDAILRAPLTSRFSLSCNGKRLATDKVPECTEEPISAEAALFDGLAPIENAADALIKKEPAANDAPPRQPPVPGQKRTLVVGGAASFAAGGRKNIRVQNGMPGSSAFHFLSDNSAHFGGAETAPPGIVLAAAGIGFCYMTQLGRYAKLTHQDLQSYAITQDMNFGVPGASGRTDTPPLAEAAVTHIHLEMGADGDARLVTDMAARMCFLHSALAAQLKTKVGLGPIPLP
jgi:hypothetical protein